MENNDEVGQSFVLDKEDEESMEESSVGSITIHPLNTTFPPLFFHPLIDMNSPL